MINFISICKSLLMLPLWVVGFLSGYIIRPFMTGFAYGYMCEEASAKDRLVKKTLNQTPITSVKGVD